MGRKLTEIEKIRVIDEYERLKNYTHVARVTGVSRHSVMNIVKDRKSPKPSPFSTDQFYLICRQKALDILGILNLRKLQRLDNKILVDILKILTNTLTQYTPNMASVVSEYTKVTNLSDEELEKLVKEKLDDEVYGSAGAFQKEN